MKYHISLRIVHWLVAALVIAMLICGFLMNSLSAEIYPIKLQLKIWHKEFGLLVLLLMLFRLVLRNVTTIPAPLKTLSPLERISASWIHHLFYFFLILEPIIGYVKTNLGGHAVDFFGIKLPILLELNKPLSRLLSDLHSTIAFILIAMIALHALGALKHRYYDKQDVIYRMTY